jgi:hypothetical protein
MIDDLCNPRKIYREIIMGQGAFDHLVEIKPTFVINEPF